jgi:hypothetical protein
MNFASVVLYRDSAQLTLEAPPGEDRVDLSLPHLEGSVVVTRDGRLHMFNMTEPPVENLPSGQRQDSQQPAPFQLCASVTFDPSPDKFTQVTWFSKGLRWEPSYSILCGTERTETTLYVALKNKLRCVVKSPTIILVNSVRIEPDRHYGVSNESVSFVAQSASSSVKPRRQGVSRRINVSSFVNSIPIGSTQYAHSDEFENALKSDRYLVAAGKTGPVCAKQALLLRALRNCPSGKATAYRTETEFYGLSWIGADSIRDIPEGDLALLGLNEVPSSVHVSVLDEKTRVKDSPGLLSKVATHISVEDPTDFLITHDNYNRHTVIDGTWDPKPDWIIRGSPVWSHRAVPNGGPFTFTYYRTGNDYY